MGSGLSRLSCVSPSPPLRPLFPLPTLLLTLPKPVPAQGFGAFFQSKIPFPQCLHTPVSFKSQSKQYHLRHGLPWWLREASRKPRFDSRVKKIPRRKQQPTPVFLPGISHGQRSLAGYSSWGHRVGPDLATKPPPPQTHLGGYTI